MSEEFILGGVVYPNKTRAMTRCRAMLAGKEPVDQAFLSDVFRMHPHRERKSGPGVRRYYVAADRSGAGSRCFWVERVDGTSVSWSYRNSFGEESPKSRAKRVFRTEVLDQVRAFKRENLRPGAACAISGTSLDGVEVHVDHTPPETFYAIFDDFVSARGIDLAALEIAYAPDDMPAPAKLVDRALAAEWQAYHAGRAQLRLVSAKIHLTQKRH